MKWECQIEMRCKVFLATRFCQNAATAIYSNTQVNGLMMGTEMDIALPLLTSNGGYRKQSFYLDGTFGRFYYAPNTPEGETQIRILCSGNVRTGLSDLLLSDLSPGNPGLHVEHDALSSEGVPVMLALDFDLERIRRFHDSLELFGRTGILYCFDFQKPVLEKYLGTLAQIQTVDLDKVKMRFGI